MTPIKINFFRLFKFIRRTLLTQPSSQKVEGDITPILFNSPSQQEKEPKGATWKKFIIEIGELISRNKLKSAILALIMGFLLGFIKEVIINVLF